MAGQAHREPLEVPMTVSSYLTVPNVLSFSRLLFLPALFYLAITAQETAFLVAYLVVGSTDYFDGLLARRLNQKTRFGKALDSIADIPFYVASAYFLYRLYPQYIDPVTPMVIAFFCLFGLSFVVSAIRCRKPIMMHTFLLRLNGVLVYLCVGMSYFLNTTWLVAAILVIYYVGFSEEILIFLKHGEVDPDSPSIFRIRPKP
jgi:phosphatidylglycerophosphate synthase